MTPTRTLALAALAALPLGLAGCADGPCPTDTAFVKTGQAPACSGTPQQVSVQLQLCEDCSRTNPSCAPDLSAAASGQIFLNTLWDRCEEDAGCTLGQACSMVTCSFAVPAGTYDVTVLTGPSSTPGFTLDVGGAASCTGSI